MLCYEGKVSLCSFLGASLSLAILLLIGHKWCANIWFLIIAHFVVINIILKIVYQKNGFGVAVRAAFLGYIFFLGVYINLTAPLHVKTFGIYMCIMATFHYTEFLMIAIIQPNLVSTDSFVINHSPQYTIAAIVSWTEFTIESYFLPGLKTVPWLPYIGLVMCISGELLRKVAMLTAKSNFNHLVQCEKSDNHVLVTHGVYSWFRHPSYVGWFYWSIGTQIILINPASTVAYAIASWLFFNERVFIEEISLLNFFGQEYCDYQQKVETGIPFVKGYKIKL